MPNTKTGRSVDRLANWLPRSRYTTMGSTATASMLLSRRSAEFSASLNPLRAICAISGSSTSPLTRCVYRPAQGPKSSSAAKRK